MTTPPDLALSYESEVTTSGTSFGSIASIALQADDLIFVYGRTYDNSGTDLLPNNPDSTGTEPLWATNQVMAVSGLCSAKLWTATAPATETVSISLTGAAGVDGQTKSFTVFVWRNHGGIGQSGKTPTGGAPVTGTPEITLTGVAAGSAIWTGNADWNAVSGARTPLTADAGTYTEETYDTGVDYVSYDGYHPDAGAAGNKTVGWSAPTGQRYAAFAVEILGTEAVATGALTGTLPAAMAAFSGTGTSSTPTPAEVLNLGTAGSENHFSLQFARPGEAQIATATLAEIEAGFTESPYFHTTTDGARVHFEARLDAPTTAGASFSRSELREVDAAGATYSWSPATGEHVMTATTVITHLPPVDPEVVIAQVFGEQTTADVVSIRTQLVSGTIRLRVRINGTSVTNPQMASPYTVGTEFTWKIRFIDGTLEVYWAFGAPLPATPQITSTAITDTSCYFKTGLYNQANETTDSATEFGAAEHKALTVTHPAAAGATGALAGTLPAATAALSGSGSTSGALSGNAPAVTAAISGSARTTGAVTATAPAITAAFTGQASTSGALAGSLPAATAAVSGQATVTGSLAGSLPAATANSTGTAEATGSMAGQLPAAAATITGTASAVGAVAGALPAATATFTAAASAAGSLSGNLPAATADMNAGVTDSGTLAAGLPAAQGSFAGQVKATATLAGTLPAATADIAGSVLTSGGLTASLPPATASLTGTASVTGTISATLPAATADLNATAGGDATGHLTAVLPAATASLTGSSESSGVLAATLPGATATLTGSVIATGTVSGLLPVAEAGLAGATAVPGVLAGQLPVPVASLAGTAKATGVLAGTLPVPTAAITSTRPVVWPPRAGTVTVQRAATGAVSAQRAATGTPAVQRVATATTTTARAASAAAIVIEHTAAAVAGVA